jgi:hypothetical protein
MDRWITYELCNYRSYIGLIVCELRNYKSCTSFMLNYEFFPTYYELFLYFEIFSQVPCSIMRFFQLTMNFLFNYEFILNYEIILLS